MSVTHVSAHFLDDARWDLIGKETTSKDKGVVAPIEASQGEETREASSLSSYIEE